MNIYEKLTKEIEQLLEHAPNYRSMETGLPVLVYVSTQQGSHGPRIKIMNRYGNEWKETDSLCILISDNPKVVAPKDYRLKIKQKELKQVFAWIIQNKELLLNFWYGKISKKDLEQNLTKLDVS